VLADAGSIPAASTTDTPSNIQRRPKDGVFLWYFRNLLQAYAQAPAANRQVSRSDSG